MKLLRLTFSALGAIWLLTATPASADVTTGYISITTLGQQAEKQYVVFTSTSPTGTGCTYSQPLVLNYTNSPYPSFDSMAPVIMAAFLYNKPISFQLHGCDSGLSRPVIVSVWVEQ